MKTVVDRRKIHSNLDSTPHSFQMMASRESFEVMSDGLYPNKIKAVLRELHTNGTDSHVTLWRNSNPNLKLNRDIISSLRQPEVYFPTAFEPQFSYRDYGVGLGFSVIPHDTNDVAQVKETMFSGTVSECEDFISNLDEKEVEYRRIKICDDVTTLYTTYFYSNKNQSNDYTGCLGLGSKAPFGYTDNFTVTVWFDGRKRVYAAVIQDGIPNIRKLSECDSAEHTGVEMKFATKGNDSDRFVSEFTGLWPYFILKPEVTNVDLEPEDVEYIVSGNGWGIREEAELGGTEGPRAIMGSIAYPIELQHLGELSITESRILSVDIDIHFDIGDLQITPSREALSYKDHTINSIKAMIRIISKEMVDSIQQTVSSCDNLWEARCLARTYFYGIHSRLAKLSRLVSVQDIKWNGNKLGASEVLLKSKGRDKIDGAEIILFHRQAKRGYYNSDTSVKKSTHPEGVIPKTGTLFVNMDLDRGTYSRCQHAMAENDSYEQIVAVRFTYKKARKEFCELFGIKDSQFINASSLEKAPSNRSSSGTRYRNSSQVFRHTGDTDQYQRWTTVLKAQHKFWENCEVDLDDGGVYVEMCRYRSTYGPHSDVLPYRVGCLIEQLNKAGIQIQVYGVRSQIAKKFRKSDDWVDLWTYAKNALSNKLVNNDFELHIANSQTAQKFYSFDDWQALNAMFQPIDKDSPVIEFLSHIDELNKSYEIVKNTSPYTSLASTLGIKLNGKCLYNLKKEQESLFGRYPLLNWIIDKTSTDTGRQKIADYINLVDKSV
ncbi:MAG: hypothetical protein ACYSUK_00145 [Planctomycetota bacterium]|jgi:hypothetical protein